MAKGNRGGKRAGGKRVSVTEAMIYQYTDAENLTQAQIHAINLKRRDVFLEAFEYSKNTAVASKPTLSNTETNLYDELWYENNYDALKNRKASTLNKVRERAQYEYDRSQRLLAKGNYDVRDDYVTSRGDGKRYVRGEIDHFPEAYKRSQRSERIIKELDNVLKNKGAIK